MQDITSATVRTMTSREIAELTGKQHKDVLYDIRKMLDDLGLTSADFSADLPDSYGRPQPAFRLPKREPQRRHRAPLQGGRRSCTPFRPQAACSRPGFVGKDVAERLGYADTVNAIKQHCRGVAIHHPIPDALGRMQQTRILTEPDVLRANNLETPE